jgi:hypothetical protein
MFCGLYQYYRNNGSVPFSNVLSYCLDNIKTDLLEIGVSVVDWIGLAQDRYR